MTVKAGSPPSQPSSVEQALSELMHSATPDPAFVAQLDQRLRSPGASTQARPNRARSTPQLRWAVVGVLLVVSTFVGVFRYLPAVLRPAAGPQVGQPSETTGQILPKSAIPLRRLDQRPVTYLPMAGYIDLENTWVLNNALTQEENGMTIQIIQGVIADGKTMLWAAQSGEPFSWEGAWLQLAGGNSLPLDLWSNRPDSQDQRSAYLQFPAIPSSDQPVVLSFPQGWRIPLSFAPATSSSFPPANLAEMQCIEARSLRLCLQAAAADGQGAHLLISATSLEAGAFLVAPLAQLDPLDPANYPRIVTPGDATAVLAPGLETLPSPQPVAESGQPYTETLNFENLPADESYTLILPAISLHIPIQGIIIVDVGSTPQPGAAWPVNLPVAIAGQAVVFEQARLEGDGFQALELILESAPLDPVDGRLITQIEIGAPAGVDAGYGYGYDTQTRRHQIRLNLINTSGQPLGGEIAIPILGARLTLIGPYEFPISQLAPAGAAPPGTLEPLPTTFEAAPTALPPQDGFIFTGRMPVSGDLLFIENTGQRASLYAANPSANFVPEPVAALPGSIYAMKVLPGGQEIIYLTGQANADGYIQEAWWHAWQVGSQNPRPIMGPFAYQTQPVWSPDGRFAYFTTLLDLHSASTRHWLVDLGCRQDPTCLVTPQEIILPAGVSIFAPRWTPDSLRLAFSGSDENTISHAIDIYLLDISQGLNGALLNLTRSENRSEQVLAWLGNGSRLLVMDEPEINIWGLSVMDLQGSELLRMPALPFSAANSAVLAPDEQTLALYGTTQGKGLGVELMTWQIETAAALPISSGESFSHLSFSSDSRWLAFIEREADMLVADTTTGTVLSLLNPSAGSNLAWSGWVP